MYSIEKYVGLLAGSPFIKESKIYDNSIEIVYYKSYEEYAQNKKNSLNKELFDGYFETGNKIEKILITEPIRLLRQFPQIERVGICLREYRFIADRSRLNSMLGFKIEDLSTEDGSWVEFVDNYTYSKENRPKLFESIKNFSENIIKLSASQGVTLSEQFKWVNDKLTAGNFIIGDDGSLISVNRELTKQEEVKNKMMIYFLQGVMSALGNRVATSVMDSNTAQIIRDVIETFFK